MKALSMLQPWASLAAIGAKKIETRSFNTAYRGPLLIHASLGKHYGKGPGKVSCREVCYQAPFRDLIGSGPGYDKLPFGAIIAKVDLVDTMLFGSDASITWVQENYDEARNEFALGDWAEGRYGWIFANPELVEPVIPAKGSLSLWDFDYIPNTFHVSPSTEIIKCDTCNNEFEIDSQLISYKNECEACLLGLY